MADISDEIRAFKSAKHGEDVRDGFINLAIKLNDVVENMDETVFASYGTISAADAASLYANKVSHITNPGAYLCSAGSGWTDTPEPTLSWALLVYKYAANYVIQEVRGPLTSSTVGDKVLWRVVKISTQTVFPDGAYWVDKIDDLGAAMFRRRSDNADWSTVDKGAEYDYKCANIIVPGAYLLSAIAEWTDTPIPGPSYALCVFDYIDNYVVQQAYRIGETYPELYWRIVSKRGSVYVDWRNAAVLPPLAGKTVSIMGDSIGAYSVAAESDSSLWEAPAGDTICEGNIRYYPRGNVTTKSRHWIYRAVETLGMKVLVNNSWSGRAVTTCKDDKSLAGKSFLGSAAYLQSQIDKLKTSDASPDVIIVEMGTNDYVQHVPMGTYDGNGTLPTETGAVTSVFRDCYGLMLNRMIKTFPDAQIFCCTLPQLKRYSSEFPEKNNQNKTLADYNAAIKEIAINMGAKIIDLYADGVTFLNIQSYCVDWEDQKGLHPNNAAMVKIATEVLRAMG